MNNFLELEMKYNADNIKLVQFRKLMDDLKAKSFLEVSSFDIYYTNNKNEFIRFRNGSEKPELTIKRKTKDSNNQNRIEINLPIKTNDEKLVEGFVDLLGFSKNFKIFKSCFIYFYDFVDIVYYTVYDEEMKEQGRYLEIEVLEDKISELGVEKSFEILKGYETLLAPLGISAQNRLRKSLFETYVRE
jgi:adenylate cyclase class IV